VAGARYGGVAARIGGRRRCLELASPPAAMAVRWPDPTVVVFSGDVARCASREWPGGGTRFRVLEMVCVMCDMAGTTSSPLNFFFLSMSPLNVQAGWQAASRLR